MEIRGWRKIIKYIILAILVLPIILPLFHPGFPVTDDADWFIIRFTAFHQSLASGQFPVRWLGRLNHNYGYPVANFNYPAYMYIAEIPKVLGFSFVNSFKVVLIGSIFSMALFSFLWLKKIFNKWTALIGSVFYIYNPYLLFDIYKRGSIGEVLALAVVSFLIYSICVNNWIITGIGYGLLIVSHNTLALIFIPILGTYQLLKYQISNIKYLILSLLLGLGLSSFFWIPALFELQFTVFDKTQVSNFSDYFIDKNRLQIMGLINIIVLLSSIIYWIANKKSIKPDSKFFISILLIAGFLTLPISNFIWKVISLDKLVQFPFRLLSLWVVGTAFLSALLFNIAIKHKHMRAFDSNIFRYIFVLIIIFFLYIQASSILKNIIIVDKADTFYSTNEDSTTIHNEYMPKWVKENPAQRAEQKIEILKTKGQIINLQIKDNKINLNLILENNGKIRLNTIYYPGWKAFIDEKETNINYNNDNGVMEINVPKGNHDIKFIFGETPLRIAANLISVIALFIVLILLAWNLLKLHGLTFVGSLWAFTRAKVRRSGIITLHPRTHVHGISRRRIKKYKNILIVVIISFFALKPLFNSGYFPVHDSLQVERIYEMAQALKDGHFPVRWVKDLGYGYGYPLFNFYAPLPYYFGALFYLLGFNLIISAKLMFGAGILLAGVSMYLFARETWGNWGGLFSAVLYQYLPYHAVQIYVRGSVGEYWAYAFLPLLALAVKRQWVIFGGLAFSAVILSHNISALLITGFLIITLALHSAKVFWNRNSFSSVYNLLLILIVGLSLSAFFWLPAFAERDLTQVDKVIQGGSYYADHFVQLGQLWNSPWGYGGSAPPGSIDGMSFKLGKFHIMLAIISTLLILFKKVKQNYLLLVTCYLLLVFSIFMMLNISQPVWQSINLLQYIQFPWRFLMFAGFIISILGGGAAIVVDKFSNIIKAIFILLAAMLVVINIRALPAKVEITQFKPEGFFPAQENNYISDYNLKWDSSKRSDEYLAQNFIAPQNYKDTAKSRIDKTAGIVKIAIDRTHMLAFNSNFEKAEEIKINIGYFPGWKTYVDGAEKNIQVLERGFKIKIPSGEHKVMIRFENTKIRIIGNIISLISLLSIIFISGVFVRRNGYMVKWLHG